MLSLAYILALRSLPDSTLSIAGSSSRVWSQRSNAPSPERVSVLVGVEGRLRNPGPTMAGLLGDPEPIRIPQEGGLILILMPPNCKFRITEASSLTEFTPSDPLGDMGGESDGEYRVELGDDPNESKPSRLGDRSYESLIWGKTRSWSGV